MIDIGGENIHAPRCVTNNLLADCFMGRESSAPRFVVYASTILELHEAHMIMPNI